MLHKSQYNTMSMTLFVLMLVSLFMYIAWPATDGHRFYFPQYRFFEIACGGISGICCGKLKNKSVINYIGFFGLSLCFLSALYYSINGIDIQTETIIGVDLIGFTGVPIPPKFALLLTVFFTCLLVINNGGGLSLFKSKLLKFLGVASFSFYIWHQIILAFYRYSFSYNVTFLNIVVVLTISSCLSIVSYYLIECKLRDCTSLFTMTVIVFMITISISFFIYFRAGIVRDVPELNISSTTKQHRGYFSEYCDRIFNYQSDFSSKESKIKVLIVGNSFARDMANILLESPMRDSIAISYIYNWRNSLDEVEKRYRKADVVFIFSSMDNLPLFMKNEKGEPQNNVYGIGTKNFGYCNGIVYKNRVSKDYLSSTTKLRKGYYETNKDWCQDWGDQYIDLLSLALVSDEQVRVFTPDGKFISQDCLHLTEFGAKWYASVLNIKQLFLK